MENNIPVEQAQVNQSPQQPPVKEPKENPLKNKWLLALSLIVLLLMLTGGAYFLGRNSQTNSDNQIAQPTSSVSIPTSTPSSIKVNETENWKTYTSVQLPNNSLKAYSISYPDEWTLKTERKLEGSASDLAIISKDNYSLKIYQGAFGGGGCIFEGEMPEGPYGDYRNNEYTEIDSGIGKLRRLIIANPQKTTGQTRFDFCVSTNNKDYGSPTHVGEITYTVPDNFDSSILLGMDKIIKTIKDED